MKKYNVTVNGTTYEVEVEEVGGVSTVSSEAPAAAPAPSQAPKAAPAPAASKPSVGQGEKVNAPMPGTVLKINVSNGQQVKKGDVLCVLEAMKMENDIVSPKDGTITSVVAKQGATVNSGDVLVTIG
mgnify:CR=1 FL=1